MVSAKKSLNRSRRHLSEAKTVHSGKLRKVKVL